MGNLLEARKEAAAAVAEFESLQRGGSGLAHAAKGVDREDEDVMIEGEEGGAALVDVTKRSNAAPRSGAPSNPSFGAQAPQKVQHQQQQGGALSSGSAAVKRKLQSSTSTGNPFVRKRVQSQGKAN